MRKLSLVALLIATAILLACNSFRPVQAFAQSTLTKNQAQKTLTRWTALQAAKAQPFDCYVRMDPQTNQMGAYTRLLDARMSDFGPLFTKEKSATTDFMLYLRGIRTVTKWGGQIDSQTPTQEKIKGSATFDRADDGEWYLVNIQLDNGGVSYTTGLFMCELHTPANNLKVE